MTKRYNELLNELDNLVIALGKQENEPEVIKALKQLYNSRNKFKAALNKTQINLTKTDYPIRPVPTVGAKFLDLIADEVNSCH